MKSGQIGSFRDGLVPLPFLTIAAVTWEQKVISAGLVAARPLAPIFGLEGADLAPFPKQPGEGREKRHLPGNCFAIYSWDAHGRRFQ